MKRYCLRNNSFYHSFTRAKKHGKGERKICAPAHDLKAIQKKIKSEILDRVETHPSCTGYKRGISIVDNARRHVGQRFVLNIDIKDFFASVNTARVAGLFISLGFEEEVALLLARLSTFRNTLPQGAPSSPAIANLICHRLDRRLAGFARSKGLNYSRYCDDITISGASYITDSLLAFLKNILEEEGFKINESKTRVQGKRSCQTVTGLTVNVKVNIPRRRKRQIRAVFDQVKKMSGKQRQLQNKQAMRNYICGLNSYLQMVSREA